MSEHEASGIDIALGDIARLEDVVDREALSEVCKSFFELFGLSIRVLSTEGSLIADVHQERHICKYINTLGQGRRACAKIVGEVKALVPDKVSVAHPCFTGARYLVEPISYQGRQVGRFVIGPYLPAETKEVPKLLLKIDPEVDKKVARDHLAEMPRVRAETAERIVRHLRGIIDLLLFSSHRAHLTSEMHILSVRESYRELAEKTAKLQSAYDRLKELDRLKSNFLATVSHELRTPLTSIIGYSEMLESGIGGDMNSEQLEFVQTIRNKGDHLLALITSLLDLGKLEQGALSLSRAPIDTSYLLDDIAKTITPHARKKDVTVAVNIAEDVPSIDGDLVRLRQVLSNLAENAVKFTPKGGTVHLDAISCELGGAGGGMGMILMAAPKPAVQITVRDTGIGMAQSELSKIFDAFYQVDGGSTREHGGAGLGLSIVRRLLDAHDGEITVASVIGEGTSFTIKLPAIDDSL